MSLRGDLLTAAAASAAKAASVEGAVERREHAAAAKMALEAAHLAQDVPPDEIAVALDAMSDILAAAGLDELWRRQEPAVFLTVVAKHLAHWRSLAGLADSYARSYEVLASLCRSLERDFTAGGSDTSMRIAARIHTALEEAGQQLPRNGQEENTDG